MNKQKLKDALEFAKDNGLESIEVDGIKFSVPNAQEPTQENDITQPITPYDHISDEEVLYWSTGYYDEMQSIKELQLEQKKETEELNG